MTAQLALFAPTSLLSECQPGDSIRLPWQRDALTIDTIRVIGEHVQGYGMWHRVGEHPPRFNNTAVGAGGFAHDDTTVEIITPR